MTGAAVREPTGAAESSFMLVVRIPSPAGMLLASAAAGEDRGSRERFGGLRRVGRWGVRREGAGLDIGPYGRCQVAWARARARTRRT